MRRFRRSDARAALDAILVLLPVVVFVSIVLWFSHNPIAPGPADEASATNPVGFLTSNFVYDGLINVENIVASSVFLLVVCIFFPRALRTVLTYLLPFIAIVAGGLAELTAVSTHYVNVGICIISCSFYGMSGIASAAIGFTIACFFLSFGLIALGKSGRLRWERGSRLSGIASPRNQSVLAIAFLLYLVLLLFFAGLLSIPSSVTGHSSSSSSGNSTVPPPPAILVQAPPVAFVHSASLVYGFLLAVTIFMQVNRRYHIFDVFSSSTKAPDGREGERSGGSTVEG